MRCPERTELPELALERRDRSVLYIHPASALAFQLPMRQQPDPGCVPRGASVLPFKRVYGAVVTVTVVLFATLPFSRQLSFWALGFDQSLMDAASVDSFRAYRETAF